MNWTHQHYFRRFRLNVEQYGEILVAHVFDGTKMGDAQPCFDIQASEQTVRRQLLADGAEPEVVARCFLECVGGEIRIEVKSKLARTPGGRASVIHCSDNKVKGVRSWRPATHFAVILFEPDGSVARAWLVPAQIAQRLRRIQTKSRYIPVSSLVNSDGSTGVLEISRLLNKAASTPLLAGTVD